MMNQKFIPLKECSVMQQLAVTRFGQSYLRVVRPDYHLVYTKYDGKVYYEKVSAEQILG